MPEQEFQDIDVMAFFLRQPQGRPLTGVQAVIYNIGGVTKYLACSDESQSESVYHLYQELLRTR